jgi:hypothetical protein
MSFTDDMKNKTTRAAFIGASYWTAGGGISVLFPDMLSARGWPVQNEGLLGSLQDAVTERGQEETEIPPEWVQQARKNAERVLESQQPLDFLFVMGHSSNPDEDPDGFADRVAKLTRRMAKTHPETQIVLVSTWVRPSNRSRWKQAHDLYMNIGENLELPVVSLARLWHQKDMMSEEPAFYRITPSGELDHHNSYAGSYAASCLLYAFMTGEKFVSKTDHYRPKQFHPQQPKPGEQPWELSPDTSAALEDLAWQVYKSRGVLIF